MTREEKRIKELIQTTVPTLKNRWPELNKYSDEQVASLFNDFYFSADAGDNDAKFPQWFKFLVEGK